MVTNSDAIVRVLRTFFLSNSQEEKGRMLDQLEGHLAVEFKKIFAGFDEKEIVVKLFDTMASLSIR